MPGKLRVWKPVHTAACAKAAVQGWCGRARRQQQGHQCRQLQGVVLLLQHVMAQSLVVPF
jgi:hypothetical protein